jgi:hypothetical protein
MTIPGSASPLLLRKAAAAGDYAIERSLRFNSSDSAYLSRTPASAGNRKTWTFATWLKLGKIPTALELLFGATSVANYNIYLNASAGITFDWGASQIITSQVFRDPSAWYHFVFAIDTTQGTASNRVKIYVNNSQITAFSTANYPGSSADGNINNAESHRIGSLWDSSRFFDGYLADIHFIDGQALDPTSFGEFDATTGVWVPIEYTGTYGTNGFHLDFADNASTTTIGYDAAGSNDWTANNLSVTAGAGNDSLVDVPTNGAQTDTGVGGQVRGNYCTANPLDSLATLSNGNLQVASPSASYVNARGTIAFPSSGKWYAEATVNSNTSGSSVVTFGLASRTASLSAGYGNASNIYVFLVGGTLICYNSTTVVFDVAGTLASGDVMQIAYDADTGKVWVGANNTWRNSSGGTTGDPGAGTNQTLTLSSGDYFPFIGGYANTLNANFGQRPFAYTAPSGFKALNTANLPAPLVTKPSDLFDVKLYTGNGSTQTISGLGFSPDLVWIKNRAAADSHKLTDTVRGATEELESDTTAAEATNADGLTQFNSDGFDLGDDDEYNTNTESYVAWAWDAGTTTASNTDGSISSQVRANASAGFSIVTYAGNGSAGATVGHGLGVAPSMIIIKNRDAADAWQVYHAANTANPETDYLVLNTTAATADALDRWNDTAPTSTLFTLGDGVEVNTNTEDYVAYCFAGVVGYSSFGSYTGNGSADGPFVYTGFRPRWILIKRTPNAQPWNIYDTARDSYNIATQYLFPNSSQAEAAFGAYDILSNGFKIRTTDLGTNASGDTYIYAAFAESPFQYARAR